MTHQFHKSFSFSESLNLRAIGKSNLFGQFTNHLQCVLESGYIHRVFVFYIVHCIFKSTAVHIEIKLFIIGHFKP